MKEDLALIVVTINKAGAPSLDTTMIPTIVFFDTSSRLDVYLICERQLAVEMNRALARHVLW